MPRNTRQVGSQGPNTVEGTRIRLSEKRRDETYENVVRNAKALFVAQGYEKTTTKQIAEAAGILNGSLFHLFPTKEHILKAVALQAYTAALNEAGRVLKGNNDVIITIGFPAAMELYAAYGYPRATELLLKAHSSWIVINGLVDCSMEWMENGMDEFTSAEQKENFRLNLFVLWGCLGSLISECYHGQPRGFDSALRSTLTVMCALLDVRLTSDEIDAVERHLSTMLSEGGVRAEIFYSLES